MQIEMTIKGLMVDPITNMPIIILRDKEGQKVLPIWVGIFEANAIALQIENVATPRPMTHDLLRNVIHDLKASVQKIVVCDLQENTFYALIYLGLNGDTVAIDARPSDAIALALRTKAPIFVEDTVIDNAKTVDFTTEKADADRLHKWLESLDPDDLGKNKMCHLLQSLPSRDRRHRQSKRWSGQDDDGHQPGRGPGPARQADAPHRPRPAGELDDVVSRHAAGVAQR